MADLESDPELAAYVRERVEQEVKSRLAAHGVKERPDPKVDPIGAINAAETPEEVEAAYVAAGGRIYTGD